MGLSVPIPTPPPAWMRNWFCAVEPKLSWSVDELSDQTKVPSWLALAPVPAARLYLPSAMFSKPPGIAAAVPLARLFSPPATVADGLLAVFPAPPATVDSTALAVLSLPPPTVAPLPDAVLARPPATVV